jgi:hypothetical protein
VDLFLVIFILKQRMLAFAIADMMILMSIIIINIKSIKVKELIVFFLLKVGLEEENVRANEKILT